jgi:hypothetical protein
MATTYAEYYGAVFPAESDVATGEVYGPTGAEYTGTLSGGGVGDALEVTSQSILTIVTALESAVINSIKAI